MLGDEPLITRNPVVYVYLPDLLQSFKKLSLHAWLTYGKRK